MESMKVKIIGSEYFSPHRILIVTGTTAFCETSELNE